MTSFNPPTEGRISSEDSKYLPEYARSDWLSQAQTSPASSNYLAKHSSNYLAFTAMHPSVQGDAERERTGGISSSEDKKTSMCSASLIGSHGRQQTVRASLQEQISCGYACRYG
eukprot:6180775-Pleurochrysis_carterae.AAC.3